MNQSKIRNVAIIAHVDHGKTTLVDGLLKQSHVFRENEDAMQQTTIMDSNDLERERGITILAKNTAVIWNGYKINILDTPGHADFSGEVERVLNMADGCLLLVDAAEGVLSQTRYVLKLALKLGLKPIVVINKIDRKDQRAMQVVDEVSDLFLDLAAHEDQLDFPIMYAISRDGVAGKEITVHPDHTLTIPDSTDLTPLFNTIIETVPAPSGDINGAFQFQVNSLDADDYKGRYVIGRVWRGKIAKGDAVVVIRDEKIIARGRCEYLYTFQGLKKIDTDEVSVGDIIALTGIAEAGIGDTLANPDVAESMPKLTIEEPTLKMGFWVNTSPFAGKEGQFTTSRRIHDRLYKELETNVGLRVTDNVNEEGWTVSGRGELHLSIFIETLRREGFEFAVSRPEVILKEINGQTEEPWELVSIEVPSTHVGVITSEMGNRKGELQNMQNVGDQVHFEYKISTRNLIGLRNRLLTDTSGLAITHSLFLGYGPMGVEANFVRNGVLIVSETGTATTYGLNQSQERGITFIEAGTKVYEGMIYGMNSNDRDLAIKVTKEKQLTNTRSATSDISVRLSPPKTMSLEQMIDFIARDELLEVTPQSLRMRKKLLSELDRKRDR